MKQKFFTVRLLKTWNRLPRELVNILSLEMVKVRLDGALSNLKMKLSLLIAEGLD